MADIKQFKDGGPVSKSPPMAKTVPVTQFPCRFPSELVERVDRARGNVSRNAFVRAAVESALSDDTQHATRTKASATGSVTARGASRPATPSRRQSDDQGPREGAGLLDTAFEKFARPQHSPTCGCAICKPPKSTG